jgi:hypothetical protein
MSLKAEFHRAEKEGWLKHFQDAARMYLHRSEVLMAIASRESNMGGAEIAPGVYEWLTRPGDNGHGFGLMQIDGRSFPSWVETGAWRGARAGIFQGAAVLHGKRESIVLRKGKKVTITDSRNNRQTFVMPQFHEEALERIAIAAYNCGLWAAYHASLGRSPDRGTTGRNYSTDVLARASVFKQLLAEITT